MIKLKISHLEDMVLKTGKELNLPNIFEYPRFKKIIVHIGTGKIRSDAKTMENISSNVSKITGQMPSYSLAKKSVASFKVRKGEKVGLKVSLRGDRAKEFLIKLIKIVLPAIRDFRGISIDGFDKQGNFNFGIREISVFPEISFSDQGGQTGLQITLVSNVYNIDYTKKLLENLGFPFKK